MDFGCEEDVILKNTSFLMTVKMGQEPGDVLCEA